VKKKPVAVNAAYCGREILSVGRFKSNIEAPEMKTFDMGALSVYKSQHFSNFFKVTMDGCEEVRKIIFYLL